MNVITQSVVRAACSHLNGRGPGIRMLPVQFATSMVAVALSENGLPSPIRAQLTSTGLRDEARRLGAWTEDPGRGYLWLSEHGCGVIVELDGAMMVTVDSDVRTVARARRPVSDATLGFLDPGLLAAR